MERNFEYKKIEDLNKVKFTITKLERHASIWWDFCTTWVNPSEQREDKDSEQDGVQVEREICNIEIACARIYQISTCIGHHEDEN